MESQKEMNAWREVRISRRFINAFRGARVFWATSRHLSMLVSAMVIVIFLGVYFGLSGIEWIMLVFSIGFVVVSEMFNTAIEIDINLTSPGYHPFARDTKDVAATAVVLSIITSAIVGLVIFLPKIF